MGKGGGGGGHTPYEAPETGRSKQSVRVVESISEGVVKGLVDGMKSIYLDDTPIQNADNSFNFSNVTWQGRKGLAVQDQLSDFDTSEREVNVGQEVKKSSPLTRTITDKNVSRLRLHLGVSSLFSQNDQGDTLGSSVNFIVTVGDQTYPLNITGKYSSQYLRQLDIENLPSVPFLLKVERVEPDSKSQRLQNKTIWASYTEIIEGEYTYPHTALMGIEFDSEYFSAIPTRSYEIYGIECLVPSNYNPITRTYTGDYWDGAFKTEWTDNPLWVLYDLMTNKRYGLGHRIDGFSINKWAFYTAAQYCDQLVPDGFGGQEPRFTCNVWISESRKAYDLINDICSCFRGLPVWNGSEFSIVLDRPSDPVWVYTNANVIDGEFEYSSSANKDRHNSIQITYFDKLNSYKSAIELVQDDQDVAKNGLKQLKKAAFGCTSRGQAHRMAKWILETERLETEMVTFTVGREGLANIPGDIIRIADSYFAGTEIGGRIISAAGKIITVDRDVTLSGTKQVFSYVDNKGKERHAKIAAVKNNQITLVDPPISIAVQYPWTISNENLVTKLYRCITVQEKDGKDQFTISAIQHEPQKEAIVDNGANFEPRETTLLNTPKVGDIQINIGPDGKVHASADTTGGVGLVTYDIFIYKDGKLYSSKLGRKTAELDLDDLENGEYTVVIRAKNQNGQLLNEKAKPFTIDRPPAPTGVRATGGLGNITLEWDWINDATATEIFAAETDDIQTAKRIAKVTARMYTHEVGAKQVRYYWLRHTRGINVGPFYQQSGLRAESAVDIDEELALLNEKLSQNIVNEVIDTALPARNLELIKTVTGLNVNEFAGYNQVHNTTDGKLYTWNGTKYVDNSIDVGKLQIPTKQLTGTLTAQQIGANVIGTQHLGANIVTADKMAADSVSTAALQAGAVRASHVAAGELTADKLAIGLGGNLLYNPIFANPTKGVPDGWTATEKGVPEDKKGERYCRQDTEFKLGGYLKNENVLRWHNKITNRNDSRCGIHQNVAINAGHWYMISAYMGNHSCKRVEIYIDVRGANGEYLLNKKEGFSNRYSFQGINNAKRVFIKFQAPPKAVSLDVFFFFYDGDKSNPNGAWMFVARPMLEECTAHTKEPSAWQNAGVTAIHGGSIVTNTITAQQIASNTITSNQIAAGTIVARNMAAGSINASHVVSKTLTADKLNISSLSAISANLGRVTAGTITGTTIEGNNIRGGVVSGTTINGSTINGGLIKGARIEGITGEFTGSLRISQLVGGNIYETLLVDKWKALDRRVRFDTKDSTGVIKREYYYAYEAKINILPSGAKRWVQVPFNITTSDYSHMGENENLTLYKRGNLSHLANGSFSKVTNTTFILNENQQLNIKLLAWASNENSLDKPLITTILYSNSRLLVKV
ncbi:hypothetical protein BKG91_03325 [Rodentibacter caecimuris]|uniref:host specificity protein J n=1 Tax=Rodentibacter caecimuris TaxID=1796644 RepID=UPI0007516B5B|nr:phage tail protein [Rodentibacter heylii]AOF53725.1 Phage tail fiber protein [Pasteurellaceae bacterium NI1060]OOF75492.1 hypothetical protein BKG91_03325 [Rodentibacter heylii]